MSERPEHGSRSRDRQVPFGRTAIIVEALVAAAFLVYLLAHEGLQLPLFSHDYTIRAAFVDATGLKASNHSPVLVAGVPEGRVESVVDRDGLAVATLQLPDSVRRRIHDDATVSIVPRSAIMDLMVDIAPGAADAPVLPPGSLIPPARTGSTVAWDRVIDVLDADTRAYLQVLLGQLDVALHGRTGQLRGALEELGRLVDGATSVTRQLAYRRALLAQLVGSLDTMTETLARRGGELAGALDAGQRTLAVTAAHGAQLDAIVRALPPALDRLTGAMQATSALATPLVPALSGLGPAARALPADLRALRAFVPAGQTLVADLHTLVARGTTPVGDLRSALAALAPGARALTAPARQLLVILQAIDRHRQGIGQLGDNFSGVFSTDDRNGVILRGLGFFEPFNPVDLGFPAGTSGARLARAAAETVTALTRVCLRSNPLACLVRYEIPGLPGSVVPMSRVPRLLGGKR